MSQRATRIVEVVVWWGLCLGVWLISLSAISLPELVVAVLASFPCAVLAVAGRHAAGNTWRFRARAFAPAALLPVAIVSDTAGVLASALPGRRRAGEFTDVHVEGGAGKGPAPDGRRAVATLLVTLTPGSFVADIHDDGTARVHVLTERGPRMERIATR